MKRDQATARGRETRLSPGRVVLRHASAALPAKHRELGNAQPLCHLCLFEAKSEPPALQASRKAIPQRKLGFFGREMDRDARQQKGNARLWLAAAWELQVRAIWSLFDRMRRSVRG